MNYDKIKRTGILFLLGIGAITSLSCNDNDNANYPERVPTRLFGDAFAGKESIIKNRLSLSRRM